jgi:hydroxyacylglutathione hydrolase
MKTLVLTLFIFTFFQMASGQIEDVLKGKEVYKNDEVVFHQIDDHTWVGTGNLVYNESIYLVEGNEKAVLIDAGTKKPVILVATHVHPDQTGSAVIYFSEININPADTVQIAGFMPDYKGQVKYLNDGEIIDLGGRALEVVFTSAHTPGSTTFVDKVAGYGFSGDSFGSGNLLLSSTFSELIATCEKTSAIMEKFGIRYFYPGHYYGNNPETKQRVDDMITLSKDVLSGKVKGESNPNGMMGLNLIVNAYGVKINYREEAIR